MAGQTVHVSDVEAEAVDVAIIGAGVSGLLLSLSLRQHLPPSTTITIYESRPPTAPELASGVILTPNGCSILTSLDIYDLLKPHCWTSPYRTYVNDRNEISRRELIASKDLYGFENHRLYRRTLLRVVKEVCAQRDVQILYQHRFEGIVHDTDDGVTFTINGSPVKANILLGADGVYSSVRRHIAPSLVPEYTGTLGILAHISRSNIAWPSPTFPRQCTIQAGPGALVLVPEEASGESIMVAMQTPFPPQSRADWDALGSDTERMCDFFRRRYDEWHPLGKTIIDEICHDPGARNSLYLWPFVKMPRLDSWCSATGNVVLVGDAAHAIPPSSGQGVNQALEDVWALGIVLGQNDRSRREGLELWQRLRQERVDAVYAWSVNVTGVARMPEEERRRLMREGKVPDPERQVVDGVKVGFADMAWLYRCKTEETIRHWIHEGRGGASA